MNSVKISNKEFAGVQKLMFDRAGITLPDNKQPLVVGRLAKRLAAHSMQTYSEYLKLIESGQNSTELQTAIDLLTTNETYFFRETRHFDFLQRHVKDTHLNGREFRVWSAACSYGQEPYSVAMVLAHILGIRPWEVIATDISTRVLDQAKEGIYSAKEAEKIPASFLRKYCLKGVGEFSGSIQISKALKDRVKFRHLNLNGTLPGFGEFDFIFLRNVMIYFDMPTKTKLVERVKQRLRRGGYLFIGHSETLNGFNPGLKTVTPSIYQNV